MGPKRSPLSALCLPLASFPTALAGPASLAIGQFDACTVTHVGGGYGLTAGHCFEAPSHLASLTETLSIEVKWGWLAGAEPLAKGAITAVLAFEHDEVADWAIVRLADAPQAKLELALNRAAPLPAGAKVSFRGYPEGKPLWSSGTCVLRQGNIAGKLFYDCENATSAGTSGAAVTEEGGEDIVAVHDGQVDRGDPSRYATGVRSPNLLAFARAGFSFSTPGLPVSPGARPPLRPRAGSSGGRGSSAAGAASLRLAPDAQAILSRKGRGLVSFTVRKTDASLLTITDAKAKVSRVLFSRYGPMRFQRLPTPVRVENTRFGPGEAGILLERVEYSP